MNKGNFWELIATKPGQSSALINERAIEIIRRSSSAQVFKGIMGRLSLILGYARHYVKPKDELVILGQFILEPEVIIAMEQSVRIVKLDIHVHRQRDHHEIIESSFNLIINKAGEIIDLRNNL
jgi:hypothetical protein